MRALATLALATLLACGGTPDTGELQDAVANAMSTAGVVLPQDMTPMTLEARDVERFIEVMEAFRRTGVELDQRAGPDPGSMSAAFSAMGANAEAMEVLRNHDLDLVEFYRLSWTVMLAAAGSEMGGGPDPNEAMAEMERLKATLTPEQAEAMAGMQQAVQSMAGGITTQPEGNVELVAGYLDRIKAISAPPR